MEDGHNFDLLDYWRAHSTRFPNLSRMARDYLAIPGTSTPSERAFSAGRQLITDFRCRLNAETITACMLLKDWFKLPDNVLETYYVLRIFATRFSLYSQEPSIWSVTHC